MNGFNTEEIAKKLDYSDDMPDDQIPTEIFGVIYSLGRDAENQSEYEYAYNILLDLCGRKSRRVRACAILALSLMADSGILEKDRLMPIILEEYMDTDELSRGNIAAAVDDLNMILGWDIKL